MPALEVSLRVLVAKRVRTVMFGSVLAVGNRIGLLDDRRQDSSSKLGTADWLQIRSISAEGGNTTARLSEPSRLALWKSSCLQIERRSFHYFDFQELSSLPAYLL